VDALGQAALGAVIEWLDHADQLDPETPKQGPDGDVVLEVAGEPVYLVDHHHLDVALLLDAGQHGLEGGPVGGAGALAPLEVLPNNADPMLGRIAGAGLALGRQRQAVLVKAYVDLTAGRDPQVVQPLSHPSSLFRSGWPGGWNLHRADPATPDRPTTVWEPAGRPWTARAAATRARARALRSAARTHPVEAGVEAGLGSFTQRWRLRLAALGSTSSQPGSAVQ